MKRLSEVRRGSTDRQYAKARKAMAQSIEAAEAKARQGKGFRRLRRCRLGGV